MQSNCTSIDNEFTLRRLTRADVETHLNQYIAISADVSPWTAENFLKELPGKWELSFSIWCDRPVGYCIMSLRGGSTHIHQFMVSKELRGRGIGARMISEVKRIGRGAITLKVHPHNVGARRFYERHGFQHTGDENGYLVLSYVGDG